jgi:DNA topoisomerase-1
VQAAAELGACLVFESMAEAKRNIVAAVAEVAKRLGNTAAVCRKCYIHPAVLDAYVDGKLPTAKATASGARRGLRQDERAILKFLKQSQ